jgi:hypothetical protein
MNKLICNGCGKSLPTSEFSKCRARKTGYQSKCKLCNKKDNDKYRGENKEYWSYEHGYFSDKSKWEYISHYMAADKSIKIYKIVFPNGKHYIGSTKTQLHIRMQRHLSDWRRYMQGHRDKCIPLLHDEWDKMFTSPEQLRDFLKDNTYCIEETNGGRKRQLSLEQFWIDRFRNEGYELLNSYNPTSSNKYKVKYRNQKK